MCATRTTESTCSTPPRHVKVSLDGVVLAESKRPKALFETGLPMRATSPARGREA